MYGFGVRYHSHGPFNGHPQPSPFQTPHSFQPPHSSNVHLLSPFIPRQTRGAFPDPEFARAIHLPHLYTPHNQLVNYNYNLSIAQQKNTSQQCTHSLGPHEFVSESEPPRSQVSRTSSQSSIFSHANFDGSPNGVKEEVQSPTIACSQLPSVEDFMEGAKFTPKRALEDLRVSTMRPRLSSQSMYKSASTPGTHFIPSFVKENLASAQALDPPLKRVRYCDEDPFQPYHPTAFASSSDPLAQPKSVEIPKERVGPLKTNINYDQVFSPINRVPEPQPLPRQLKKAKKTISYKFEEDANALFFCNTKIDYKFIVRHLARESLEHKFKVDLSQAKQRIQITDDDLVRWCVLEFLYNDIKLHDRRFDPSPLIHNIPENRFGVSIEFGLVRKGTKKTVKTSMTLLKPSSSRLKRDIITKDLSRVLAEVFLNHQKDHMGNKRRWSSTRPQWGLGADDELSILDLDITIT